MHLEEVLCSSTDQRCIAIDLPIPWPAEMCISQLPEMRRAFNEIVIKAYAAVHSAAIPTRYHLQQQQLNSLMSLMNAEFAKLLKLYALSHAKEAFSVGEELEGAKLIQLTFEGLSLELTTSDPKSFDGIRMSRKVWSTSILFDGACTNADEVEEALISMFTHDKSLMTTQPSL